MGVELLQKKKLSRLLYFNVHIFITRVLPPFVSLFSLTHSLSHTPHKLFLQTNVYFLIKHNISIIIIIINKFMCIYIHTRCYILIAPGKISENVEDAEKMFQIKIAQTYKIRPKNLPAVSVG